MYHLGFGIHAKEARDTVDRIRTMQCGNVYRSWQDWQNTSPWYNFALEVSEGAAVLWRQGVDDLQNSSDADGNG